MPRVVGIVMTCLGVLSMQSGAALPAAASVPVNGTIMAAPADQGVQTLRWSGNVGPTVGNLALRCFAPVIPADNFSFNLTSIPAGYYNTHKATLRIRIDWTPATPASSLNLTSSYYDGTNRTQIKDGIQTGSTFQEITYSNPDPAVASLKVSVDTCSQNNPSGQDYTGFATLKVVPLVKETQDSLGPQLFQPYISDIESRDLAQRPNSGEPNIGVHLETGKVMYMAGNQVSQVTYNDSASPPTAKWKDVTPTQEPANEDQIIITDRVSGRTWAAGLLLAGSNIQYTDDDGTSWQQGTFPVPHSPDHETLGSGPYPASVTPGSYPRALYYCSQNVLQAAGAFCGASTDGGLTYNPSVKIFGTGTPCGAIHGHVRVAFDGTAMVPQKSCGTGEGYALSSDLGNTWTYAIPPDSTSPGSSGSDPTVAAGNKTVYFAYSDGTRHPMVTTSSDRGTSWTRSIDVGAAYGIQEAEFPEVVVGDDNRAAVTFIGTTTLGDDQTTQTSCTEACTPATTSTNTDFFKGAWDLYIAFTYDRGVTWQTTKVPGGPIQRGCVWLSGGGTACRNMLDFNEITVDKQGRVLVSYTEGCTAACKTSPTVDDSGCSGSENANFDSTATCTFARRSGIARQYCGKGLFQAYDGQLPGGCFTAATNAFNPNASGNGLPDTAAVLPAVQLPVWSLGGLIVLVPVAAGLVHRRRRRSR